MMSSRDEESESGADEGGVVADRACLCVVPEHGVKETEQNRSWLEEGWNRLGWGTEWAQSEGVYCMIACDCERRSWLCQFRVRYDRRCFWVEEDRAERDREGDVECQSVYGVSGWMEGTQG